jgi:hypothetical protein
MVSGRMRLELTNTLCVIIGAWRWKMAFIRGQIGTVQPQRFVDYRIVVQASDHSERTTILDAHVSFR